jgi:hypothetical protein
VTVPPTFAALHIVLKLSYQNQALRNLSCKRIQCDEIWSFCYAKQKNVPADKQGQFGYGDVWTWTALCADTKRMVSWKISTRGASTAYALMHDRCRAFSAPGRVQSCAQKQKAKREIASATFFKESLSCISANYVHAVQISPNRYSLTYEPSATLLCQDGNRTSDISQIFRIGVDSKNGGFKAVTLQYDYTLNGSLAS